MKITICTFGTRGDTQPYVALAIGLQQAGHQVTLVASHDLAEWIQSYGINVFPLNFSLQEFIQRPEQRDALKGRNVVRILRDFRSGFEAYLAKVMDDCQQAAQDAEFLVLSSIASLGVDIARQRGIPLAVVSLQPLFPPTRAFPMFMLQFRFSLGGGYNHLTYTLYMRLGWLFVGGLLNHWRTTCLGLSPWRSMREMIDTLGDGGTPWLYAYSPPGAAQAVRLGGQFACHRLLVSGRSTKLATVGGIGALSGGRPTAGLRWLWQYKRQRPGTSNTPGSARSGTHRAAGNPLDGLGCGDSTAHLSKRALRGQCAA